MTLISVLSATMRASTAWNMNSLELLSLKDPGKNYLRAQVDTNVHVHVHVAHLLEC